MAGRSGFARGSADRLRQQEQQQETGEEGGRHPQPVRDLVRLDATFLRHEVPEGDRPKGREVGETVLRQQGGRDLPSLGSRLGNGIVSKPSQ